MDLIKIPEHVIIQVKQKYSTMVDAYKQQCPYQLKNVAVNLELVEKVQYCTNQSRNEMDNASKWVHLSYGGLFKAVHDSRKRILLVGEAGIGKTILCTSIVEDWINEKLFQEFFMVLFLPLNHKGVISATNLIDLFKFLYKFDSKICSELEMYLTSNKKDNILIIADGWELLCESNNDFLHCLLFGEVLASSTLTVIVTSRSFSISPRFINRFITVQGFSEETTKLYIHTEFSSNPKKLSCIIKQLDTNPLIGTMCTRPLNLAMICNLCRSCDDPLPNTMPELYDKLAWSLKQLRINRAKICQNMPNYHNLEQSWSFLLELAFRMCHDDTETASLPTKLETFGLIKPVSYEEHEVTFCFVDPAFRYYFAVSYMMMQPQSISLEVIERMGRDRPMFWRFFLSMSRNVSYSIISKSVQMLSKLCHSCNDVYLISYESKKETVDREIIKSLHAAGSTIMLHSNNAYECVAMIHVLENIQQRCIVEISFQSCKLKPMQISKLSCALGNQCKIIRVNGLDLSGNSLNDSVVSDFFSRAVAALKSLVKLFLRSCDIGAKGIEVIINTLATSSCKNLAQLDLSFNSLSVHCLEYLQCHIDEGNLQKIEILILKGSFAEDINVRYLKSFVNTLSTKCQCLRRLDLSDNKLGPYDDEDLCAIVSQLTANFGNSFDLRLDDNYMSEVDNNFLTVMEESIRNKGRIDHTIAHGVIVGPGRAGKDTLMRRLMGEGPPDQDTISPSTGVLENVVKVEVKKLCTVATAVSDLKWQRLEYDEEALELMTTTAKNYTHIRTVSRSSNCKFVVQGKGKSRNDVKSSLSSNTERKSSLPTIAEPDESKSTDSVSFSVDENKEMSKYAFVYSSDMAPVELFKKAVKLRRMDALREHLESSWSLYLTNTGGQIEFQEHLPLLVCGPSLFFVTFPLHHDLEEPYDVQYQYPDGSVKKYSSTPTLMQELLQTLATIYALDLTSIQVGDTDIELKPKIFFVGTHKDYLLGPDLENTISQIDKKIQKYIRQTELFSQGSIQFACSKRMIFTVNNLSKDDNDFQKLRSAVQQTVEKRCYTEFTVQCPSSWLIFSLIMRAKFRSNRVLKFEDCFKIAQECGISTHEELTTALSFIHSRLGLVRYFDVEELNSLVVIDPKVLFDKITDLIVKTFVIENAEQNEIEDFQTKGIISVAVMKRINERSNQDVQLPFEWFAKLLNHLRIAALFKDHHGEKYFFPSALCHVLESQDSSYKSPSPKPQANQLSQLLIAFKTGFPPRGMSGALIVCLMTNEMKSSKRWELLPDKIYRNQVSFHITGLYDVTFKIFPTHFEITLDSEVDITKEKVVATCSEVSVQISKSMKIVTQMYGRCEYFWTFYCTRSECASLPHPAAIEWDDSSFELRCKVTDKYAELPNSYKVWNIQREQIQLEMMSLESEVQQKYLGRIADSMAEWEGRIADELGLTVADTAAIKKKYPGELKLQSREALQIWKQRKGNAATYMKLIRIFELSGYQEYADNVRKIGQAADNDCVLPEVQPPIYPIHTCACKPHSVSEHLPPISKSTETYMIVDENLLQGDVGEVCSVDVLESHNMTMSFIPKLTPVTVTKSDLDGHNEQHFSKPDISEAKDQPAADSAVSMVTQDRSKESNSVALDTHTVTETTTVESKFSEPVILPNASISVPMMMEQHIQQTNERLLVIRQQLGTTQGFVPAAKELLDWCSDIRAFQPQYESGLMGCLQTVNRFAASPGFDLNLGYRLLAVCANHKDRFSPPSSAMLTHWCEDLGRLVLVRHQNITARIQGTMDINRDPQQATMQIAQAAAVHAASHKQQPFPKYIQRPSTLMLNGQEGAAVDMYRSPIPMPQMQAAAMYRQLPGYYASSQGSPAQSTHGQYAMSRAYSGTPTGPGGFPAQSSVHLAPSTSTLPAPPPYGAPAMPTDSGYYGNLHNVAVPSPLSRGYMSSEMAAMQSPPAYPSPGRPNMANYPAAMYPNSGRPYPLQQDKQPLRLTFPVRDGVILNPFQLEHGKVIIHKVFILKESFHKMLVNRNDLDLQFSCYLHNDKQEVCTWPIGVSVSINEKKLQIDRGGSKHSHKALHLKHCCIQGQNWLEISVSSCCCSHVFLLQLVHRPSVNSVLQGLLRKRLLPIEHCIAKIKKWFSSNSDNIVRQTGVKVSLRCPVTFKKIKLPARGAECRHIQCFDLEAYLQMNCNRDTWKCPVCSSNAQLEGLEVDQYVWSILGEVSKKGSDVDEITIDPSAIWTPIDKPKDSGKDDEADNPPQKKVKLDTSAPGTPSTSSGGGVGTPRGAGGSGGSSSAGTSGDGLQKTSAASNCNNTPLSQASTSEQSLHQSSSSSLPPVGYGNPSTNSNTSATHNHHYQEQNTQLGNSHNSSSSSNLRNSMVAHHQPHQGYVASNGSVLVNGGSSASSRQLQGGQSSSSTAAGSRASQSGQSSQVPVMNHQPQRDDSFDDDLNLGVLDELGDANEWLGCLDDELPSQEILSSILDIPDSATRQQQS